jgi:hypothetical protein
LKSPRIKLLKKIDGFSVYEVNGEEIRKSLNDQFTNFGQHYRFPKMIPLKEFWIDRQEGTNETPIFINHMLTEWRLMNAGLNYDTALTKADEVEKEERGKPTHEKYHKEKLGRIGDVNIWVVDGAKVRKDLDVDFTEGGHDLVYGFVPKNEIWIDDDLLASERIYILDHEYFEREKMKEGMPYENAHNRASFFERAMRHKHPHLGRLVPAKKTQKSITTTLGSMR